MADARRRTLADRDPAGQGPKTLTVAFDNGESFELPAEYLRVEEPERRGAGPLPGERKTVPGKRNVQILEVSRSAIMRCGWCSTTCTRPASISWDYLRDLGRKHAA